MGVAGTLNPRQHKGEPRLPFNLSLRALFLLLRGGLLLFLATVALHRCFVRPPCGVKSKRIFLSADLLFRQAIQPVRELPEGSFIVLCPVAGHCKQYPESTPSPKKSVSCVSAVLFLLCQSRYVLFLLGLPLFLFLLCHRDGRTRANFEKPFKINDLIFCRTSPG